MIYFVQREADLDRVKIGTTIRLSQRLKQLAADEEIGPVKVLAVMDGGIVEEAALHEKFGRHHLNREWFRFSEEIREFVAESAREWDGTDEVTPVDVRLRMEAELADRLHAVARRYGTTLAAFVRAAAIKELERIEKEDKG